MTVQGVPRADARALTGLLAMLAAGALRGRPRAEVLTDWLRDTGRRLGRADFVIGLGPREILFVASPELSAFILDQSPSQGAFVVGSLKRKAMSFLAPRALTILSGEPWREMRPFNEAVLGLDAATSAHVAARVAERFAAPLADIADTRDRMGAVMLDLVFAGAAPDGLAETIHELFGEVRTKTAVFGSRKTALRDGFRAELDRLWAALDGEGTHLLARAQRAAATLPPPFDRDSFVLDQIPHWMFTFPVSGADLLATSLALIQARPEVLSRARAEVSASGAGATDPTSRLPYVAACIREAGRLYPPAPQVTHRAARDVECGEVTIPAGTEIMQYFPVPNRDTFRAPDAEAFRPGRWLDPSDPVHRQRVNTFLSGPRTCPGRDLILLVVKTAIAAQLRNDTSAPRRTALSEDPLPFKVPAEAMHFSAPARPA